MNQILQDKLKNKIHVEISNDFFEIPYENSDTTKSNFSQFKNFLFQKKYQIQFIISFLFAVIFLSIFLFNIYQMNHNEQLSKELLNNYSLTTLYQDNSKYEANKTNIIYENPFVIGMIKIDKIKLNYPILSESNYDLLKISLCRFAGPMPNEVGNLCIAGHNYVDNKFFSHLNKIEKNDIIEIYDLNGNKINYIVFQKFEVSPNDLSCTNQNTKNGNIITLLTCDNVTSKRLVVQAKQQILP